MAECPVCGEAIRESGICSECGFDLSLDYEHYPTVNVNLGAGSKTVFYYREEYKKNNPDDIFICSACGGKKFLYAVTKGSLICCKCHKEYAQVFCNSAADHYSEGMAPISRLNWELQKKFHRMNENDVMTIKVYDDVTYAISGDGNIEIYDDQKKQIISPERSGIVFPINNIKYVTRCADNLIFLSYDGSVNSTGDDPISKTVKQWDNITAVSSSDGYVLGLKNDGVVLVAGAPMFNVKDDEIKEFKDITEISAGSTHAVGLRKNGTVVAVGLNNHYGQCETESWRDIIAISAGEKHTLGLRADGTVVSTKIKDPALDHGQCNTGDLKDIVAVSAGRDHSVFLDSKGQVIARGDDSKGQCEVKRFYDIIAINAHGDKTAGLRADGRVIL